MGVEKRDGPMIALIELRADVVTGAKRTFISLEKWFGTFCADEQVRHERP
jgi:hypothetical protein